MKSIEVSVSSPRNLYEFSLMIPQVIKNIEKSCSPVGEHDFSMFLKLSPIHADGKYNFVGLPGSTEHNLTLNNHKFRWKYTETNVQPHVDPHRDTRDSKYDRINIY